MIIPERLVSDDDENIILNLLLRTQRLINLAQELWPIVHDNKTTSLQKYELIQKKIEGVRSLGETWVKMLMVVLDIAMPHMKLLHDRCPVGSGASDPLRKILEDEGILLPKEIKTVKRKDYTGKYELEAMKGAKFEIVAVHKSGKQLLQVTQGMAGTLDRAHAVAVRLAEYANIFGKC